MLVSPDVVSVSEWVNDSSITVGSQRNRQYVVTLFEKANRASMNQILESIRADKLSVYSACKRFLDYVRKDRAPMTVYVYRSQLVGLFQSVLGEDNFRRTVFDRLCPNGSVYVTRTKQIPTRDQVRTMLNISPLTYKTVVGGLAIGGFRINEWLKRKMSDLEIREQGYARVKLQAEKTKGRYLRYTFLTREVVDWVKVLQKTNPSEYVFGGLNDRTVQYGIKRLFEQAGMKDSADGSETYCAHSFRTFAGDEMRACGLGEKSVLAIIGHVGKMMGAESHYLDWNRIEKEWVSSCSEKMCFLDTGAVAQKRVVELTRQNGKLEALLEKLLERLT